MSPSAPANVHDASSEYTTPHSEEAKIRPGWPFLETPSWYAPPDVKSAVSQVQSHVLPPSVVAMSPKFVPSVISSGRPSGKST